jgi:hypothetical protein
LAELEIADALTDSDKYWKVGMESWIVGLIMSRFQANVIVHCIAKALFTSRVTLSFAPSRG